MMCIERKFIRAGLTATAVGLSVAVQWSAAAQGAADLSGDELELVQVNWFDEMLQGGFTMVALAALSVALVAFIIERAVRMRSSSVVPAGLLAELLPLFGQKRYDKIVSLCQEKPSTMSDIATFFVAHRKADPQILLTAAGDLGARSIIAAERRCQPFAVIAGIAPLLGLLGTMIGMIESFKLVEVFGDEGGASLLAGSISKALITTAVGLVLAIPAMIAYHFFKHRAQSVGTELEVATETLFNSWFLTPGNSVMHSSNTAAVAVGATRTSTKPRPAAPPSAKPAAPTTPAVKPPQAKG